MPACRLQAFAHHPRRISQLQFVASLLSSPATQSMSASLKRRVSPAVALLCVHISLALPCLIGWSFLLLTDMGQSGLQTYSYR